MSTRFKPGNRIGERTRFQPGWKGGPGRPKTAKFSNWIERLGKQGSDESVFVDQWEQFTRTCLREALNGSKSHAQLLARYAGNELWREMQQVIKQVVEDPDQCWILRRRPPSRRKVTVRGEMGQKRADQLIKTQFSHTDGAPQESTNVDPYQAARELVGSQPDREPNAPQPRRAIKVQLW